MEDSYFAFLGTAKRMSEPARISAVVSELQHSGATDGERSKIRSRVGSSSMAGLGLGMSSSLPSVPSLPSLARGSTGPGSRPSSSFSASSAMSLPGVTNAAGRHTFGGGSSGGGGTRQSSSVGIPPIDRGMGPDGFGAQVTAPRSGKMVYVLVAVLIGAICILAILLFSGGGPASGTSRRKGGLDLQPAAAPAPVTVTTTGKP
jgi:hypothetical protein